MTREILFRGKRLDNGEWVEGNLITGTHWLDKNEIAAIVPLDNTFFPRCEITCWFEVDPSTVGQFTGLCDKNSKKIFEGDIVKPLRYAISINSTELVEYDGGGFSPFAIPGWECTIEPCDVAVIGNIADNPELLEDEE